MSTDDETPEELARRQKFTECMSWGPPRPPGPGAITFLCASPDAKPKAEPEEIYAWTPNQAASEYARYLFDRLSSAYKDGGLITVTVDEVDFGHIIYICELSVRAEVTRHITVTGSRPSYKVYKHPPSYPDKYVCRRFTVGLEGTRPDPEPFQVSTKLADIRNKLQAMGCFRLPKSGDEAAGIVGEWI